MENETIIIKCDVTICLECDFEWGCFFFEHDSKIIGILSEIWASRYLLLGVLHVLKYEYKLESRDFAVLSNWNDL